MGRIYRIHKKPRDDSNIGLPKEPVQSAYVTFDGIVGDYNHFRSTKLEGTFDRALLFYTREHLAVLSADGWPVGPGDLGENILTEGIPYEAFDVGRRLIVGNIAVEITEACKPCWKLGSLPYVGEERQKEFVKYMVGRRGWYAKILRPGNIKTHDPVLFL